MGLNFAALKLQVKKKLRIANFTASWWILFEPGRDIGVHLLDLIQCVFFTTKCRFSWQSHGHTVTFLMNMGKERMQYLYSSGPYVVNWFRVYIAIMCLRTIISHISWGKIMPCYNNLIVFIEYQTNSWLLFLSLASALRIFNCKSVIPF